jgi:hypothetical protein
MLIKKEHQEWSMPLRFSRSNSKQWLKFKESVLKHNQASPLIKNGETLSSTIKHVRKFFFQTYSFTLAIESEREF